MEEVRQTHCSVQNRNRAAIYARFSSHNQRSESIEIQVEKSRAYCDEHALEVVRVYTGYAHTSTHTDPMASSA